VDVGDGVVWNWIWAEFTTVPGTVKPLVFALNVGKATAVGAVTEFKGDGSATVKGLAVLDDKNAVILCVGRFATAWIR